MSHPVENQEHGPNGDPSIRVKVEGSVTSRAEHEEDLSVNDFLVELNKLCSENMRAYDAHSTALTQFKSATMRDISSSCRCVENNGLCSAETHDQSLVEDLSKHITSYRSRLAEGIVKLCSLLGPSRMQHLVKWCERHAPIANNMSLNPEGTVLPQHVHETVKTMVDRDNLASSAQLLNMGRSGLPLPSLPVSLPGLNGSISLPFTSSSTSMAHMMSLTSPSAMSMSGFSTPLSARVRVTPARTPLTLSATDVPLPPNVSAASIDIKSLTSNDIVGLWRNLAPRDLMKQYSHRAKKLVNAHIRRVAFLRHQRCPTLFTSYFKHKPHIDAAERDVEHLDMRPDGLFASLEKLNDHDLQRLWLHCREDRRDRPHPLMALTHMGNVGMGQAEHMQMQAQMQGQLPSQLQGQLGQLQGQMQAQLPGQLSAQMQAPMHHGDGAVSSASTTASAVGGDALPNGNVGVGVGVGNTGLPGQTQLPALPSALPIPNTIPAVGDASTTAPTASGVPGALPTVGEDVSMLSNALSSTLPNAGSTLPSVNMPLQNLSLPNVTLPLPNVTLPNVTLPLPTTVPVPMTKEDPETPAPKRRRTSHSVYATPVPSHGGAGADAGAGMGTVSLPHVASTSLSADDGDDGGYKSPDARHTPCPSRIPDALLQEMHDPLILVRGVLGKLLRQAFCDKGDYPSVTHCARCHLRLVLLQRHNADPNGGLAFLFPAPDKVPLSRPPFPELISYLRNLDTWYLLRLYHIAVPAAKNVAEYVRLRIMHAPGNACNAEERARKAREMGPLETNLSGGSSLEHLFEHGLPPLPAPVAARPAPALPSPASAAAPGHGMGALGHNMAASSPANPSVGTGAGTGMSVGMGTGVGASMSAPVLSPSGATAESHVSAAAAAIAQQHPVLGLGMGMGLTLPSLNSVPGINVPGIGVGGNMGVANSMGVGGTILSLPGVGGMHAHAHTHTQAINVGAGGVNVGGVSVGGGNVGGVNVGVGGMHGGIPPVLSNALTSAAVHSAAAQTMTGILANTTIPSVLAMPNLPGLPAGMGGMSGNNLAGGNLSGLAAISGNGNSAIVIPDMSSPQPHAGAGDAHNLAHPAHPHAHPHQHTHTHAHAHPHTLPQPLPSVGANGPVSMRLAPLPTILGNITSLPSVGSVEGNAGVGASVGNVQPPSQSLPSVTGALNVPSEGNGTDVGCTRELSSRPMDVGVHEDNDGTRMDGEREGSGQVSESQGKLTRQEG